MSFNFSSKNFGTFEIGANFVQKNLCDHKTFNNQNFRQKPASEKGRFSKRSCFRSELNLWKNLFQKRTIFR